MACLTAVGGGTLLYWLDQPAPTALLACAGLAWALRTGSLAFGWRRPVYRARPPRR